MAESVETSHHAHHDGHGHAEPGFVSKYLLSTDHKMIAMQYLFTGMAMALIGGFAVYVFRMQLAFPGQPVPGFGLVTPGEYNMLVTTHGSVMIFWAAWVTVPDGAGSMVPRKATCPAVIFRESRSIS